MEAAGSARELGERLLALEVEARQSFAPDGGGDRGGRRVGCLRRRWVSFATDMGGGGLQCVAGGGQAASAHRPRRHAHDWSRQALTAGVIGVEQADLIARLHAHPRCRRHLAGSVELLVDHAQRLDYREFVVITARFRLLADPDGTHRTHENVRVGRGASGVFVGAEFVFRANGDVLAGTEINEIYRRFVQAEFARDWDATKAVHCDAACAALMPRTHRQRCFDAFHTMARAAAGSGVVAVPDTLINLVIDLDTFADATNRLFDQPVDAPDPSRLTTTRCETVDGVPVDPQQVVALAIRAQIHRVVMDRAGRVIELGRSSRLFRGGSRDAVKLTAHHCDHPGCNVPAASCDIDHVAEWIRDQGTTDPGNGRPRCSRHNIAKHRNHWTSHIDEHGVANTYRADGSEIAPRHRPRGDDDDDPD